DVNKFSPRRPRRILVGAIHESPLLFLIVFINGVCIASLGRDIPVQNKRSVRMKNGFKILDSDMHLREPGDLWDKYMEPQWRDRAPKVLSSTARSSAMVMIDGKILQGYKPTYRGGIFDATRIDSEIAEYRAQGFNARS